jgi:tetratricopeptide (TPR) repeat protein
VAALLSVAAPAEAQAVDPYTRLFEDGLAAFDRGDPATAVTLWTKLVADAPADRAFRVAYNLGLAYEALADAARAIESYERFARAVGEYPGSLPIDYEERRQDAVDRASKLRPKVGLLRINAPRGEPVLVRVAGAPARPAGFATYLPPGSVEVVMGEGSREVREQVQLLAGNIFTLTARQLPPPPPPPPPPYEPPVPVAVVAISAAVTLASTALPVGLFLRARGLGEDAEAFPSFSPEYAAAREEFDSARTAYFVSFALPATLAALTTTLLVVDLVDASTEPEPGPAKLAASFGLGAMEVRWRF